MSESLINKVPELVSKLVLSIPVKICSHNTVSSRSSSSNHSALHPLVDLLIATPTRLLWEAFNHAGITARRPFTYVIPPLSTARCSFIQLSELGHRRGNKKCPCFDTAAKGFELGGLSRLRVRHCIAELPCSIRDCCRQCLS